MSTPPETDDADAAPVQVTEPAAAPRAPLGLTPTIAVSLALVMVLIVALVGWEVSTHRSSSSGAAAPANQSATGSGSLAGPAAIAAETAASNETRATLTYSYRHLAADFAAAQKGLTPSFAAGYRTTTAQKVTPLATRYHAVSTAIVADAGVSAITATTATVLLFVDQTVTNIQLAHPRLDRSRIKVSMQLSGGRWLISNLSPI